MLIQVRNTKTGEIFSNSMDKDNKNTILSIHFCTSYTQVCVQEEVVEEDGTTKYPSYDLIIPLLNSKENWVDLIAIKDDTKGEWVGV
jgi:hypothetical protein